MIRLIAFLLLCVSTSAKAVDAGSGVEPATYPINFDVPETSPLEFRGGLVIRPPFQGFGGLSGLSLINSRSAVLVSDRGAWVEMDVQIENGRLIGLSNLRMQPILNAEGAPVDEGAQDSEDLTWDPRSGAFWISFEGDHRIWRVPGVGGLPSETIRHPAWETFSSNTGIEALARDDLGRLWAVREASSDYARPFPVFIWDGRGFNEKLLPRLSKHMVTGADFGPDGWLYITERKFSFTSGFEIRLRRLKYGNGKEPIADETLLEMPAASNIDNIESIDVWRENEETLILIASDDNLFLLQRNVFALFAIKD